MTKIYYGWIVVTATAAIMAMVIGSTFSFFGLFVLHAKAATTIDDDLIGSFSPFQRGDVAVGCNLFRGHGSPPSSEVLAFRSPSLLTLSHRARLTPYRLLGASGGRGLQ